MSTELLAEMSAALVQSLIEQGHITTVEEITAAIAKIKIALLS